MLLDVSPAKETKREPTSGLEPLTCSLRVSRLGLRGVAEVCKSPLCKRVSLLRFADYALCCIRVRVKLGSTKRVLRGFAYRSLTAEIIVEASEYKEKRTLTRAQVIPKAAL